MRRRKREVVIADNYIVLPKNCKLVDKRTDITNRYELLTMDDAYVAMEMRALMAEEHARTLEGIVEWLVKNGAVVMLSPKVVSIKLPTGQYFRADTLIDAYFEAMGMGKDAFSA